MFQDFVEQAANAPGNAASFPLIAIPGGVTFAQAHGTAEFYAGMDDGQTLRQIVRARVTTSGGVDTFQILETLWTVNRNTTRLVFPGAVRIYSDQPASKRLYADGANVWQGLARRLTNLAAATAISDALRRDQSGWVQVRTDVVANVGGWAVALPAEFQRIRVEWEDVTASSGTLDGMFFRLSTDGGATYHQGASDYPWRGTLATATGLVPSGDARAYGPISGGMDSVAFGELEFYRLSSHQWRARAHTRRPPSAEHVGWEASGWMQANALSATHLIVSCVGRNIASGRFRLKGAY